MSSHSAAKHCCCERIPYHEVQRLQSTTCAPVKTAHCHSRLPPQRAPLQVDTDFGFAIATSADGNVVAIGTPAYTIDGVANAGAVFVFERDLSNPTPPCRECCRKGQFVLRQTLHSPDPHLNARFGSSVGISYDGAKIVVGAPFQNVGTADSDASDGKVYVYDRFCLIEWKLLQCIVAQQRTSDTDCTVIPDNTPSKTGFGQTLALSRDGHVLIVGDPLAMLSGQAGIAYIYETDKQLGRNFRFHFQQRITLAEILAILGLTSLSSDVVATSVAINNDGTTIAIGGSVDGICTGRVLIYRRKHPSDGGCVFWHYAQSLSNNSIAFYGTALAMSADGKYLAVEGLTASQVYRQHRSHDGSFPLYALEGPALISVGDINVFGLQQRSIAISDDGCVVAVGYEVTTVDSVAIAGDVAVFDKGYDDDCNVTWTLRQRLTQQPVAVYEAEFGAAVSMSGDASTLLVGAPFAANLLDYAYVFDSCFKERPPPPRRCRNPFAQGIEHGSEEHHPI
jgi:hypothetical protein